jgi:1-acyl-sn-glycerol-3-phosphate acyltransferase
MFGVVMFFVLWFPLNVARRLWWRWRIEGIEKLPPRPQGMILAANHLNWTDIHVLGASLPLSHRPWWMAKAELFSSRAFSWWLRQMQVIPIKRGKRDMTALVACEDALRAGAALVVIPEGHRSQTGQIQQARGGVVRLAVRTGCPIVPVAIWGTELGLRGAITRKPIHVVFGTPYRPDVQGEHIPFDRMNELTDEVMLRIASLMPEQYWGVYRARLAQSKAQVAGLAGETTQG